MEIETAKYGISVGVRYLGYVEMIHDYRCFNEREKVLIVGYNKCDVGCGYECVGRPIIDGMKDENYCFGFGGNRCYMSVKIPCTEAYIGKVKFEFSCAPFSKDDVYEIIDYEDCNLCDLSKRVLITKKKCAGKVIFNDSDMKNSHCLVYGEHRCYIPVELELGSSVTQKPKRRFIRLE